MKKAGIIKKVLFTLFSIFLAYRSLELLRFISKTSPSEVSFVWAFILAGLLNLFLTGIFAFVGFVFASSRVLPLSYYRIKQPGTLNAIYKVMGVKYFRSLLLMAFWGKEKNRKNYFNGSRAGLDDFDLQTRQSEFGHLAAFVVIILVSLYVLSQGHTVVFVLTTLLNVLSNAYPVVLQRKHRLQIQRLRSLNRNRPQ